MTSIIDVEGMTRDELDTRVVELAQDHMFQIAADLIVDWIEWDWHGRYEPEPVAPVVLVKAKDKKTKTVASRLLNEFGDLGNTDPV